MCFITKGEKVIIPRFFTERRKYEEEIEEEIEPEQTVQEALEDLLQNAVSETSSFNIESDEATKAAKNLHEVADAYKAYSQAKSDEAKAKAQVMEAYKQKPIIGDQTIARICGIVAATGVVVFWTAMEQGKPIPMRLVQFTQSMTLPKL